MKTDIEKACDEYKKLRELIKEREGKTITKKFANEIFNSTRKLERLMLYVEPETIEKLSHVRRLGKGEWMFQLSEEDRKVTVTSSQSLFTITPYACNRVEIENER